MDAAVVSNRDNSRKVLADPSLKANGQVIGKTYTGVSEVEISPDSHWIFQTAKATNVHAFFTNAYLFEVTATAPVELRQVFVQESFAQAAFSAFDQAHGPSSSEVLEFVDWDTHGKTQVLVFDIFRDYNEATGKRKYWRIEFDLNKGAFSGPIESGERAYHIEG